MSLHVRKYDGIDWDRIERECIGDGLEPYKPMKRLKDKGQRGT